MTTAAANLFARLQQAPVGYWHILSEGDLKAARQLYAANLVRTVHLAGSHWEIALR